MKKQKKISKKMIKLSEEEMKAIAGLYMVKRRMSKISPEKRKEIAKKAIKIRWAKKKKLST